MTIYKKGTKWSADVYVNGKRIARRYGFKDDCDAKKWHNEITARYGIAPELFKAKETKDFTIEDLVENFRTMHLPTVRPNTQTRYDVDIRERILKFFQFMKLKNINNFLIQQFRSEMMCGNLSIRSVNHCMVVLKLLLNKAVEWEMLDKNPFKIKKLKEVSQDYKWWDDKDDLLKFLNVIQDNPHEGVYRLALECGMRLGEILGLSKKDIDFVRGQINVHRQWLASQGCFGPPKHNKRRTLNFDPKSDLGLCLLKAVNNSPHPEAIFTSATDQRLGARNVAGDKYKSFINKAGIPVIRFHDLRHTFASWYMIEVGDIWSLMNILGHSNIATTMRYAHLSSKYQKTHSFSWAENKGGKLLSLKVVNTDR